jgi:hypothetical protein
MDATQGIKCLMSPNRMIHSVCASQENKYGKKYNPKGMKREFVVTFGWIIARSSAFTVHVFSCLSGLIQTKVKCVKIRIMEANKMFYFSTLFDEHLYMFRTDLLSIIGNLIIIFTAIGVCYTIYFDWKVLKCGAGERWRRSVGPTM